MKLEKFQQGILSAILSFCLCFGSISCMVTGLDLNANLYLLAFAGIHLCAAFSVLLQLRWGGRFTLAGICCILPLLLCFEAPRMRILSFIRDLVAIVATGYQFDLPPALEKVPHTSADLALFALMVILALCCSFTVLRRRTLFLAMIPALTTLATCFVFTDTVPDLWCILMWLFAVVMLLMIQPVRRQNGAHGIRLARLIAIPVAAAVLGMSVLIPPTTKDIPDIPTDSALSAWNWVLSKLPYIGKTAEGDTVIQITPAQTDRVNLSTLGPKNTYTTPVFEVTAQFSGPLYLRERDYDNYSGLDWIASEDREESDLTLPLQYIRMDGNVTFRTYGRRNFRYLPCYTRETLTLTGGYAPNEDYSDEYTFYRTELVDNWQSLWRQGTQKNIPAPDSRYLELPTVTEAKAKAILAGIERYSMMDTVNKATAIQRLVRETASYDLNAATMPGDQEDFAIWFLQEAESGYCVHYATAATVLLRAAGIPARYVEGYQLDVAANTTTTVRANKAHAWVEYFLDGVGWIIMDPTPSGEESVTPPIDSSVNTIPPGPTPTTTRPTTVPTTTVPPTGNDQPTTPSGDVIAPNGDTGSGGKDLLTLLMILSAVMLVIIGQWLLRRNFKNWRMHKGAPNAQALARYREATRLARWSKCDLPEELTDLAEKAAFSQYALTHSELAQFDAFFTDCIERMKKESFLRKLYLRVILAAY